MKGTEGFLDKLGLTKGGGSMMPTALGGMTAAGLLTYFMAKGKTEEEAEELAQDVYRGKGLGMDQIKADMQKYRSGILSASQAHDKGYHFLTPRNYLGAQGGRVGLKKGSPHGKTDKEVLKELYPTLFSDTTTSIEGSPKKKKHTKGKKDGGRIGYREGDTAEVLGPVTPGKGLGDIDQGDFNLSDLGEYAQMYGPEGAGGMTLKEMVKFLMTKGFSLQAAIAKAAEAARGGMGGRDEGIARLIQARLSPGAAAMEAVKILGGQAQLRSSGPEGIADLLQKEGIPKRNATPLPEPIRPEHSDKNFRNIPTWPRELTPEMEKNYQKLLKNLPSGEDIKRFIPEDVLEERAQGGRVGKYGGGIGAAMPRIPTGMPRVNAGGISELDYRQEGGFVPMGVKEKADDVPAMLSKNEFVMTADAVKAAGGGDVEKGAQRMYDTMKRLEGRVA
jgi:hypothetical protein